MKINDKIYGEEEINELVLIELINSNPIQRLKKISQLGLPFGYYHLPVYFRYEHSLGVLILLRRLGANLNEQIAGLLHDVSHTAFSHVVDWVLGDPTLEDYQDKIHLQIIKNSEIPNILEKYNINYLEISNLENFSLLEQPTPSLCVDRIDYSLRDPYLPQNYGMIDLILSNLINKEGQIVFKNKETAEIFGKYYLKLQTEHWAGNETRARYYILSNILKRAIEIKIISINDLRNTDEYVINLLKESKDNQILNGLNLLKRSLQKQIFHENYKLLMKKILKIPLKKRKFGIIQTSLKSGFLIFDSKEGIELKKKFRYVDPEILIEGNIKKLSELSEDYFDLLKSEKINSASSKKFLILEREK